VRRSSRGERGTKTISGGKGHRAKVCKRAGLRFYVWYADMHYCLGRDLGIRTGTKSKKPRFGEKRGELGVSVAGTYYGGEAQNVKGCGAIEGAIDDVGEWKWCARGGVCGWRR